MTNASILPDYILGMEHQVFVQRVPTKTSFETSSTFLAPGQSEEFAFDFLVPVERLTKIAINVILDEGELQMAIDSSVSLEPFSRMRRFQGCTGQRSRGAFRMSGASLVVSRRERAARSPHPVS